jgi:hypothetical protein
MTVRLSVKSVLVNNTMKGMTMSNKMSYEQAIKTIDLKICWECADTRPIYAHNTCKKFGDIVETLKEIEND